MEKGRPEDSEQNKGRLRGIKASRKKLRSAQLQAGFKSQAEIVERIKKLEGLNKSPRSLVSRVFRGEPVDPLSIERVAKALNVEAWSLYLNSDEIDSRVKAQSSSKNDLTDEVSYFKEKVDTPNQNDPLKDESCNSIKDKARDSSNKDISIEEVLDEKAKGADYKDDSSLGTASLSKNSNKPYIKVAILVLCILCVLLIPHLPNFSSSVGNEQKNTIDIKNKVVAVIPISGRRGQDITRNIEMLLAGPTDLFVGSSALHAGIQSPYELLERRGADLVISGELTEIGHHIAVRLFLSRDENMQQIWSGVFHRSTSDTFMKSQLKAGLSKLLLKKPLVSGSNWASLIRFLQGMENFEGERSEHVLLRAMADFQYVLNKVPDNVYGYAGMCMALIELHLETSNKSNLEEAERYCNEGLAIEPDSIYVQNALGNLARVKGEYHTANSYFSKALKTDPNSITALQKMAESQMRIFLESRDLGLFDSITKSLNHAAMLEPRNWKIPYTQGRAFYFKGDQLKAIEYFTKAAELSLNYQTLNNLGALEFCVGDLKNAKAHYQQALTLKPNHSVLLSNIAVLHFYLGEYQQALEIFEPQIEYISAQGGPGLYQLWSNVADIYRTQGKTEKALIAYRNAISELEREVSKGEANVMQKASRLAMYTLVAELSPKIKTSELLLSLKYQADALSDAADPVSLHQLALSWLYLGNKDKAIEYRNKLSNICPGYAASPDFKRLGST